MFMEFTALILKIPRSMRNRVVTSEISVQWREVRGKAAGLAFSLDDRTSAFLRAL